MPNELTVQEAETLLTTVNSMNNFLDPVQFEQMARVAKMFSQSTIVPANYQNKPADCLIAIDMANRINVNVLFVMQNLFVVKGKPSWSGQACATLINNCGRFSDVKHIRTGEMGTPQRGCYFTAVDKETAEQLKGVEVTMAMAQAEGWTSNTKWKNMPELMLVYRAASFFAKEHCPDVLSGVSTDYEVLDSDRQPRNPASDLTNAIKAEIGAV